MIIVHDSESGVSVCSFVGVGVYKHWCLQVLVFDFRLEFLGIGIGIGTVVCVQRLFCVPLH
jgi:hypothetical protein